MISTVQNNLLLFDNIRLRLVEESDAEFIVNLRTDKKLQRFISATSGNIDNQARWIKEYKKRESDKKEFYFIFEDLNHKPWGTIRLYNLNRDSFEFGSWLCFHGNKDNIAIKAHLLGIQFGFVNFEYKTCLIEVRKKNIQVINYLKLLEPILIMENDLIYSFRLEKDTFLRNREKIIKFFKLKFLE